MADLLAILSSPRNDSSLRTATLIHCCRPPFVGFAARPVVVRQVVDAAGKIVHECKRCDEAFPAAGYWRGMHRVDARPRVLGPRLQNEPRAQVVDDVARSAGAIVRAEPTDVVSVTMCGDDGCQPIVLANQL